MPSIALSSQPLSSLLIGVSRDILADVLALADEEPDLIRDALGDLLDGSSSPYSPLLPSARSTTASAW
jgi:hypothetical protein